uniref:Uncharacterized protein LOC104213323 n=1 Tax=Nicotiana sylvestris TaxID=4096 RepID=A0A1U7V3Y8_NICSY|nr:PREDICTED: uncharacterized protein LOC104213323 [Nicotiana sylvestris]
MYNSRVDRISGEPPVLKGLDAKKFEQNSFPQSAAPKPIPKKFSMPDIPKYNGMSDPNEHIISYTCRIKGNDLTDDEIEPVLLKTFGKSLSKGAMIWYHNLPPNSIDSFAMLENAFIKAHAGPIKVAIRKSDIFKIRQRSDEILREFVSQFQMERMELLSVSDDWAMKSKIRVEDDHLGAPSGSIHPNILAVKAPRHTDRQLRSNREWYQPYVADRRTNGSGNNPPRNDRGWNSRELMSKNGFGKHIDPAEAPRLSEYNFSVDASGIVSAIGRIKDTRWPKPIQIDHFQRNPNLMCKYHGTHGHRTEDCRQLREEMMKFPTVDDVKTVYGEQHAAKEMFVVDEVTPIPVPSISENSSTKDKQTAK